MRQAGESAARIPPACPSQEQEYRRLRPSWAHLLHKIFEIDPLLCPKCGTAMKVVSVITEPAVIDRILRHLAGTGGGDPFEGRGPPGGGHEPVATDAGVA